MLYLRVLSRLGIYLLSNKKIENFNNEETLKHRFNNRFKIFQTCFFFKKLDYSEFLEIMKTLAVPNKQDVRPSFAHL